MVQSSTESGSLASFPAAASSSAVHAVIEENLEASSLSEDGAYEVVAEEIGLVKEIEAAEDTTLQDVAEESIEINETIQIEGQLDSSETAEEDSTPVLHHVLEQEEEPVKEVIDEPRKPITEPDFVVPSLFARSFKRVTRLRAVSFALLALLLISIVAPLSMTISYGVSAYTTYSSVRTRAYSGFQHLLSVKTAYSKVKKVGSSSVLDTDTLFYAKKEFAAARSDFVQMQQLLKGTSFAHTLTSYLPQYRPQVATALAGSQIGIDVADIGLQLVDSALILVPKLRGPLLVDARTPLVTSADIDVIGTTIDAVLPRLNDIEVQSRSLSLNDLPLSAQQRSQALQAIQIVPQVKSTLLWVSTMLEPAKWLLGVDQPRTFLVQTMDRGELRATGGFTGQYGELNITGGRVGPFSLRDISFVEYGDNSPIYGNLAPSAYRSWWPFANWGLRDSNLSADFPTSAQMAIQQYKYEVKRNVDGVVLLTPFLIEHVLRAIGPIQVPKYNETITADNLEERLHYYQLDNNGIRRSEIIEHVEDPAQARKLFTSAFARALMGAVRRAPLNTLVTLGFQMLQDLKTKDLQIYVTNDQIENLLRQRGYAAEVDRSTTRDGLYIVQANVSASKASQYVRTVLKDTVSLDKQGGATHVMRLQLVYNQAGPVYGLDTYRDYIRVYVPTGSKLLWGDGFDTGEPLCGGPLPACSANGIYPQQQLVCPAGQYDAGYAAPMLDDPYSGQAHPLDKVGPPTNKKSDVVGRAMFGGYVVIPKNCTMMVTLSWYVPPQGNSPYTLLVQRQASTFPELDLTMLSAAGSCATMATATTHFNGILTEDTSFKLKNAPAIRRASPTCVAASRV